MTKKNVNEKNINKKLFSKGIQGKLYCAVIYVALLVVCVCLCVFNTISESYNINVGDIAEATITAPYDVIDEYSTNMIREEEMQKVAPVYNSDDDQTKLSKQRLTDAFASISAVKAQANKIYTDVLNSHSASYEASSVKWSEVLSVEDLANILESAPEYITKEDVFLIASLTTEKISALKDTAYEFVSEALEEGVVYEDLVKTCENIKTHISRTGIYTGEQTELAFKVVTNTLSANQIYDAEATEKKRAAAADAVVPVEYKEGENIVQKGEKITQKQYELIKQIGLSSDDNSMASRWIVAIIMFFLLFGVGYFYLSVNDKQYINEPIEALNIALLVLMTAILGFLARRFSEFIIPTYLAVIVGASFMMRRLTIAFGGFLSILTAFMISPSNMFIFNDTVLVNMLAGLCGSTVAIMTLKKKQHRGEYILAGLFAGFVGSIVYAASGLSINLSLLDIFKRMGVSILSGLVCGLISVGVLPIWERLFSLATPSKLLELANPGSELLKRLMMDAPGTYHHSAVTANLSEVGCEAVGGNALLARVAAYYHDIGKLYNPKMFKENQMNAENPHDSLSPVQSAEMLRNHVVYGGRLADKYKLPIKIKDIILQHHGNSTMNYFLYKAKQAGNVNEADFRYLGPRPQTIEAGVVMMADVVEAAVRANQATLKKGEYGDFIRKLIKSKYDDGQLDMCPMNRRDLELVLNAFENMYEGANHERILYPEDKK